VKLAFHNKFHTKPTVDVDTSVRVTDVIPHKPTFGVAAQTTTQLGLTFSLDASVLSLVKLTAQVHPYVIISAGAQFPLYLPHEPTKALIMTGNCTTGHLIEFTAAGYAELKLIASVTLPGIISRTWSTTPWKLDPPFSLASGCEVSAAEISSRQKYSMQVQEQEKILLMEMNIKFGDMNLTSEVDTLTVLSDSPTDPLMVLIALTSTDPLTQQEKDIFQKVLGDQLGVPPSTINISENPAYPGVAHALIAPAQANYEDAGTLAQGSNPPTLSVWAMAGIGAGVLVAVVVVIVIVVVVVKSAGAPPEERV